MRIKVALGVFTSISFYLASWLVTYGWSIFGGLPLLVRAEVGRTWAGGGNKYDYGMLRAEFPLFIT